MLLRCIAGLDRPDRGRVTLNDRVLFDSVGAYSYTARQRRVGMLFQHYALFPHRTVRQISHSGSRRFRRKSKRSASRPWSSERIWAVSKTRSRANFRAASSSAPHSHALSRLTGSSITRRATLCARHASSKPDGSATSGNICGISAALVARDSQHRRSVPLGEQLIVLSRGRVAAEGAKEEVFKRPPSVEVARLTGCKNISRARATQIAASKRSIGAAHCEWRKRSRAARRLREFAHI